MRTPATIALVTRPGLAKVRALPLMLARSGVFVSVTDAQWRDLFDRSDVISEGSAREEHHGRMWYGSTSLILPATAEDAPLLATLAAHDMHVRLRAVRAAHREAALRAPGRLGRVGCEIRVTCATRGVRIDVDIQAPLIERRALLRPAR
jgi:hypothetical protein